MKNISSTSRLGKYTFILVMLLIIIVSFSFTFSGIIDLKPSTTISLNLAENHRLFVSKDGFSAIDQLTKDSYVKLDLTNRNEKQFKLNAPYSFFRSNQSTVQNNIAALEGIKVIVDGLQIYQYAFLDLINNTRLFEIQAVLKKSGDNYLGKLAGIKYKKHNDKDLFLVVMEFNNVYDNSIIYKGWLLTKEGILPPLISYFSPDPVFEFSRTGISKLRDFDCTNDGGMVVLAFDNSNWVFNAGSKKWEQLEFKDKVGSIVFFTPAGFLFTLINTIQGDDCLVWDPRALKKLKSLELDWRNREGIRFSSNGSLAAVLDGNQVHVWNINNSSIIANLAIPSVFQRSIEREPIPLGYRIGDGPQQIDASPDLKTIIVYSTVANNIVYNEETKKGTFDITQQFLDVYRISELLENNGDELLLKLKN